MAYAIGVARPMNITVNTIYSCPWRVAHMHLGQEPPVPLAMQCELNLRCQLQKRPVVGLLGLCIDAQWQTVLLFGHGQRDAGHAAQIGQGCVGEFATQVIEPIEHRRVVAGGQIFHRANFGRRQCGGMLRRAWV